MPATTYRHSTSPRARRADRTRRLLAVLATCVLLLVADVPAARSEAVPPQFEAAGARAAVSYRRPVPGAVLRAFEVGPDPWSPGHRGVDLAASAGQEVAAAGAGVVAFAGKVAGKPVVSIDHADGVRTTYEPVEAGVVAGQVVATGQFIGVLAAGHRAEIDGGDGLHWGARIGQRYIDPMRLLRPPIVLKPVW